MLFALCDLSRLDYMGRLRPFRAIGNLELYLLPCSEGFKAVPRNSRIMNKHIVSARLLDKSIALLCVKPLYHPFCQGHCPPFPKRSLQRHLISLINFDVKILIWLKKSPFPGRRACLPQAGIARGSEASCRQMDSEQDHPPAHEGKETHRFKKEGSKGKKDGLLLEPPL